jgi:AAA+ superfamily predicted ATPase
MNRNRIIEHALTVAPDAIRRTISTAIREADSQLVVVEGYGHYGNICRFAAKGHCSIEPIPGIEPDLQLYATQGRVHENPEVGWWKIVWQGSEMEILQIHLLEGMHRRPHEVLMAHDREAVRNFLLSLNEFTSNIEGAVLVFQDGCWRYDEDLYADIQNSTFDNIVLTPGMAERIKEDVQQWLDSRELYERHGVPWKRGMIMVGPPGNGKTHMIKALINHFGLNTLYVRGFSSEYDTDAKNISEVFDRARSCAPALMILEDLDTLVNPKNRSHFLNELDGFARNTGILTVASANDPAKLDPALVNRPSRFDRRYAFDLPGVNERTRYLQFFTASLEATLRLSDEDAEAIGGATEGFSFAYLKELVLSTMMDWISTAREESFAALMQNHVGPLLNQMQLDPEPTPQAIKQPRRFGYPDMDFGEEGEDED